MRTEIEKAAASLAEGCPRRAVVNCLGNTAGEAFNILAAAQSCDAMVVSDGVGVVPQLGFFEAVRTGLSRQPGSLFTTFFADGWPAIGMPLGGDVASQTITSRAYGPEMMAMRPSTFGAIGGFEPYDARRGVVHEYVTRASESGHDLLVFPEPLLSWPSALDEPRDFQSDPLYSYLAAKPVIDGSRLVQRKVLLAALRGRWRYEGCGRDPLARPGRRRGRDQLAHARDVGSRELECCAAARRHRGA